jgi:hypothetical protein
VIATLEPSWAVGLGSCFVPSREFGNLAATDAFLTIDVPANCPGQRQLLFPACLCKDHGQNTCLRPLPPTCSLQPVSTLVMSRSLYPNKANTIFTRQRNSRPDELSALGRKTGPRGARAVPSPRQPPKSPRGICRMSQTYRILPQSPPAPSFLPTPSPLPSRPELFSKPPSTRDKDFADYLQTQWRLAIAADQHLF